jgi:hypothetical protein
VGIATRTKPNSLGGKTIQHFNSGDSGKLLLVTMGKRSFGYNSIN